VRQDREDFGTDRGQGHDPDVEREWDEADDRAQADCPEDDDDTKASDEIFGLNGQIDDIDSEVLLLLEQQEDIDRRIDRISEQREGLVRRVQELGG
jgi:hypothetical protein